MPSNKDLDDGMFAEMDKLAEVKKRTQEDRDRMFGFFYNFLKKNNVIEGQPGKDLENPGVIAGEDLENPCVIEGEDLDIHRVDKTKDLAELIKTKEGRAKFSKYHAAYFYSLRVRDDEFPKLATAESIRSHIKNKILKDLCVDITNPENFPTEQSNWRKYTIKLTKEGKSTTKHKEEIPPDTMDAFWMLFVKVKDALENRSSDRYSADFLTQIDPDLYDKLNKIMMYGACFVLIFFEVRRGQEGLEFLKQADFKLVEDETFKYKYWKKFRSEADKNHQATGTNVACSGVIPYMDIVLDDGVTKFNPGEFFGFYLSLLPPEATKEGGKGGYLFQRSKKNGKVFSMHDPHATLYEPNSKGEVGGFLLMVYFCLLMPLFGTFNQFELLFLSWKGDPREVLPSPLPDGQEEEGN